MLRHSQTITAHALDLIIYYITCVLNESFTVGVFYAISTLLNQIVLFHYPGAEEDAGRIGLCIVVAGMMGSVCCGIVLDKTHRFKLVDRETVETDRTTLTRLFPLHRETTLAVYVFTMIGMFIYTFTLNNGYIVVVYLTSSLLGFFMTGYLPVGFEFAAELTYPEPEGTSSGLLNAGAQVFGITFTMLYSEILDKFGDIAANILMAIFLVVGTVITALIKSDLRRQNAQAVTTPSA